jgi:DNA segregation ATPase FtsK/SpoIIIE-like protein
LRVPIGLGESGQPVELDIKEAAQGGMGPHGLCVGATGSGNTILRLRHTYWVMSDRSLGAAIDPWVRRSIPGCGDGRRAAAAVAGQ